MEGWFAGVCSLLGTIITAYSAYLISKSKTKQMETEASSGDDSTSEREQSRPAKRDSEKKRIVMSLTIAVLVGVTIFCLLYFPVFTKKPTVKNKALTISLYGQTILPNVAYEVPALTSLKILATPTDECKKILINWKGTDETKECDGYLLDQTIPESAKVGEKYIVRINACFSDGFFADNKTESNTSFDEYVFIINKEIVQDKKVSAFVDGNEISDGTTFNIKAGTTVRFTASPVDEVEKLLIQYQGSELQEITEKSKIRKGIVSVFPEDAAVGTKYIVDVNALYSDGYYCDNKSDLTVPHRYTFIIVP